MIASSRIFEDIQCGDNIVSSMFNGNYDAICDRTKFGVSLGAISAIIGPVWILISMFWFKGSFGTMIEFGLAMFFMIMWTFGVVLLTFDKEKSPARELGNLYFFTWGGWSLFIYLFMESFQNFLSRNEVPDNNEGENTVAKDKPTMEQGIEEEQVTTDNVEMNV